MFVGMFQLALHSSNNVYALWIWSGLQIICSEWSDLGVIVIELCILYIQ